MATKKKTTSKKFQQKVNKIVQSDIFKSVAIASILLNVLFLVCVFVFTSTTTFDRSVYKASRNQYCQNFEGLKERAEQLGDEQTAIDEWQIDCVGSQFAPFYKEAVDKYRAKSNQ